MSGKAWEGSLGRKKKVGGRRDREGGGREESFGTRVNCLFHALCGEQIFLQILCLVCGFLSRDVKPANDPILKPS